MPKSNQLWQKVGWRSLRYNRPPRFIVRFKRNGDIACVKHLDIDGSEKPKNDPWKDLLEQAKIEWIRLNKEVNK